MGLDNVAPEWSAYLWEMRDRRLGISSETGPLPGEEPPEEVLELFEAEFESRLHPFGSREYQNARIRVYDIIAENIWDIGVVGMASLPIVYRSNLGNMFLLESAPEHFEGMLGINGYAYMWFFKE